MRPSRQVLVAVLLLAGSAAFILWQNAHVAVLWDLSFLLDSAFRFSLGQVPYRDLPFSHAPLTFLLQGALIRLFGRVYWHIIAYACVAGSLASLLTWRLLAWILRPLGPCSFWIAALLAAPLTVLGIYSIYPHPIYDSDAILVVLIALCLLRKALDRPSENVLPGPAPTPAHWSVLAGFTCTVPLFIKLNIGAAFLLSALVALCLLAFAKRLRSQSSARELLLVTSAFAALTLELVALHLWAGLGNYLHWTVQFAAQRRLPGFAVALGAYHQQSLFWSLPCAALGIWLLARSPRPAPLRRRVASVLLLAAPFLWTLLQLTWTSDPDDRADQLLALWPHLLAVAAAFALLDLRRRPTLRSLLPWILLATIHGTFLSQQLWGSTYAVWPLLLLLIALLLTRLGAIALPLASAVCVTFLLAGGLYAASHERLSYIHLEGPLTHASTPTPLRHIATPGPWLPGFQELLRFAAAEIPASDPVLLIPGEDPFFFASGRTPAFPVLLFDPATFPYSPAQAAATARSAGIRWLILKRDLQLTAPPYDQLPAITAALEQDFVPYRRLALYDVYRRRLALPEAVKPPGAPQSK